MSTQTKSSQSSKKTPRTGFPGRGMLYIMLGVAVLLVAFLIFAYPIVIVSAPETATIRIPAKATSENVRDSLTKYMGNDYADKVMKLVALRRTDFGKRHGAYTIEKGTNAMMAMRQLTSGAQTPVRLTVNGFRSFSLLVNKIADRLDMQPDSLTELLHDPKILAKYGLNDANALALFVDDTYEVYWSATPQQVINKIGANYNDLWNEERRKKAAQLGLRPEQVMVIASIVDEETNRLAEKGTIGRLYINRLHKNMKLQADPTVRYALGDFTIRRVTGQHLKVQSPYNTYLHPGLPPGPIRTTGKRTVDAILDSKPNNYLYMCAKEDFSGSHNFADNYAEHARNALRYQNALDQRNIHQ